MTMPVTMPSTITTTLRGEPTAANTTSPAMTQASAMSSTGARWRRSLTWWSVTLPAARG
jgi:hypothetical protein